MISYSLTAQNSVRVYNQNVIPGKAGDVVNLFNNFFGEAEYKSGGVMLQSVSFRNNVTHRIVFLDSDFSHKFLKDLLVGSFFYI